jgi:hypothetical protein
VSGHYKGIFANTNRYYFHGHDVTQEDVIDYCGTWFGYNHKGLAAIFGNPKYIPNDSNFEDNGEVNDDEKVIDIGLIGTMEKVVLPMDKIRAFD